MLELTEGLVDEVYASVAQPVPGRKPGDLGYMSAPTEKLYDAMTARLVAGGWPDDEQTRNSAEYAVNNPEYAGQD
jgi:hypothetical protein